MPTTVQSLRNFCSREALYLIESCNDYGVHSCGLHCHHLRLGSVEQAGEDHGVTYTERCLFKFSYLYQELELKNALFTDIS